MDSKYEIFNYRVTIVTYLLNLQKNSNKGGIDYKVVSNHRLPLI